MNKKCINARARLQSCADLSIQGNPMCKQSCPDKQWWPDWHMHAECEWIQIIDRINQVHRGYLKMVTSCCIPNVLWPQPLFQSPRSSTQTSNNGSLMSPSHTSEADHVSISSISISMYTFLCIPSLYCDRCAHCTHCTWSLHESWCITLIGDGCTHKYKYNISSVFECSCFTYVP